MRLNYILLVFFFVVTSGSQEKHYGLNGNRIHVPLSHSAPPNQPSHNPETPHENDPNALQPTPELTEAFLKGAHSSSYKEMYDSVVPWFDDKFPAPLEVFKRKKEDRPFYSDVELSGMYPSRCIASVLDNAKNLYLEEKFPKWIPEIPFKSQPNKELVQYTLFSTPCFGVGSLGNFLGDYFETWLCSYYTGLHFMAVSFIWEPATNDTVTAFSESLPHLIEHPHPPPNIATARKRLESICTCPGSCHEHSEALWVKNLFLLKPLFANALEHQYTDLLKSIKNNTEIRPEDLSNVPATEELPLIPDVAIHYRCGDNFVGHYGFLPYRAFVHLLNDSYHDGEIKTIYVLAETQRRISKQKHHLMQACNELFPTLFHYLSTAFPQAKIIIRRGDHVFLDLIRLSYAKKTICSASTFCLYPAIHQGKNAYFPQTKLIVRGNTGIDLGFQWITEFPIVLGQHYAHLPASRLIGVLNQ